MTRLSEPQGSFDSALVDVAVSLARHFEGHSSQDVEDIAQDALLKLVIHDGDVADPVAWLYVVVRRLCCRRRRAAGRLLSTDVLADPWPLTELTIDLQRVAPRLSARRRRSIQLALAGCSEREAAALLGCSMKSAEKSLFKARRHIRQLLASGRPKSGKLAARAGRSASTSPALAGIAPPATARRSAESSVRVRDDGG